MAKFLSDQNKLGFFYEPNTYGLGSQPAAGTGQWIGLVQEHTIDESINIIPIRYQGSTDRNVDAFANGALDYTGTFSYFPQDWKFLGFAIGSIEDSITAGSHVMTETNSDDLIYTGSTTSLPAFTLEDSKTISTGSNFVRVIKGCMVDSYTVTWAQGEITSCEVGYVAQAGSFTSGASSIITPTTTTPHLWNDMTMVVSGGNIPLANGSLSNVTEATLTVSNNLEGAHYLNGSKEIKEALPLNRDLELTATLSLDNANAKYWYDNYFIGGSEFVATISSIGAPGSLFITMNGCRINDMEVPSPMEGIVEQTVTINPQSISAIAYDSIAKYAAR